MSHNSWLTRIGVTLLTTIAVGAVGTPAFAASTGGASVSGTKITFKAGSKQTNSVTFSRNGRTITINDRVKIKAGKGCKAVKGDNTKVRCTTKKNPTQITAYLGDKNDALENTTTLKFYGYGGSGDDKLFGGTGTDRLVGDSGNDKIWGGTGNDRIWGGAGNDRIWGGAGNDSIDGETGNDWLDGGTGNDRIWGNAGNDSIDAGSGNDIVDAGTGNDRTIAGTGTDKVYGSTGSDRLYGNDGNDLLYGGDGNDHLDGGAGDDKLYGDAGNDRIVGDRGNDKEYGGTGNDTFDQNVRIGSDSDLFVGGTGQDLVTYEMRTENLFLSNDGRINNDGATSYDRDSPDFVLPTDEKDTISVDVEDLTGGGGDDGVIGNGDNNVLRGGGGSDLMHGEGGADRMYGDGTKFLPARDMSDEMYGGDGEDQMFGNEDDDYLSAIEEYFGQEADHLDGGPHGPEGNSCNISVPDTAVNCRIV